jgi:hypothetical protein
MEMQVVQAAVERVEFLQTTAVLEQQGKVLLAATVFLVAVMMAEAAAVVRVLLEPTARIQQAARAVTVSPYQRLRLQLAQE